MKSDLPPDVARSLDQLRTLVSSRLTSQTEIAMATGIDQSQISRILAGQVKRVSRNVAELCKFANQFYASGQNDPSRSAVLMGALRAIWDGSPAHAEAIASVLLSLRKFKEAHV
jgi:transcriptional regulator with XRE-family HTH domain